MKEVELLLVELLLLLLEVNDARLENRRTAEAPTDAAVAGLSLLGALVVRTVLVVVDAMVLLCCCYCWIAIVVVVAGLWITTGVSWLPS